MTDPLREALAEALGPAAIEAATAIERGDYGEDPGPHDGALAHADAILAHPAMVAALAGSEPATLVGQMPGEWRWKEYVDRSDPAAGLREAVAAPMSDFDMDDLVYVPRGWLESIQSALAATPSPTVGGLDVERLLAFLAKQRQNDTESSAWRSGVEYAEECIRAALQAEATAGGLEWYSDVDGAGWVRASIPEQDESGA